MRFLLATTSLAVLTAVCFLLSCTNVSRMHRAYEAGDTKKLDKLIEIVSRPDYPYATRRKAAEVLGEIGEPVAVPALIGVLGEYDQRTTLKGTAMVSLGKIGDRSAVKPIGKLLDRSLNDPNVELRMAAIPVLGQLGGTQAADILVNALVYYDLLMLREDRRYPKGVFTGEETDLAALRDSLRGPMELFGDPSMGTGLFGESMPRISMFGTPMENPGRAEETTPRERALAHTSLVMVGEQALPVIQDHLDNKTSTASLEKELLAIVEEIRAGPDGAESPPGS
jgi:hypothetical protein